MFNRKILDRLDRIDERMRLMAIDTSKLLVAVAAERTELKSWEALDAAQTTAMTKLAADLATAIANSDPAAIAQVQADLDKAATDLSADNAEAAAAITANTPAAPPTP
jgi:hypothetical protein